MAHFDVIGVGEAKIDAFMTLHEGGRNVHLIGSEICFRYGGKIPVDRYDLQMGGNAANVTVGLSRLGLKTALIAEVGGDALSTLINETLEKEGVGRSHVIHNKEAGSALSVIINFQKDRTIFSQHLKRKHQFSFDDLTAPYVYLTSLGEEWHEPYRKALKFAEDTSARIVFNPGGNQLRGGKELMHDILKHSEILFLNKEEAEHIIYGDDLRDKANEMEYLKALSYKLAEMGAKIVVITNGRHGSYALDKEGKFYHEGMYPMEPVERTGAGDAFASGFVAAVVQGENVETAMRWGSVNSACVVAVVGAEAGLQTKEEMKHRLEHYRTV